MLNLSVDRIYSTVAFSIALLKEFSLFGFPNKRVLATIFNCSQNTCIYCSYFVNESLSLKIKIWRNGEKMKCFFNTTTAVANRIDLVFKVMFTFMLF